MTDEATNLTVDSMMTRIKALEAERDEYERQWLWEQERHIKVEDERDDLLKGVDALQSGLAKERERSNLIGVQTVKALDERDAANLRLASLHEAARLLETKINSYWSGCNDSGCDESVGRTCSFHSAYVRLRAELSATPESAMAEVRAPRKTTNPLVQLVLDTDGQSWLYIGDTAFYNISDLSNRNLGDNSIATAYRAAFVSPGEAVERLAELRALRTLHQQMRDWSEGSWEDWEKVPAHILDALRSLEGP